MKAKRIAMICTVVVLAASQAVAASAPTGECGNLGKMYGLFMRASEYCNFKDSGAIQKTINRLKMVCPSASEKQARSYVVSGFTEFDKQLRRDGEAKACREAYIFMEAIGQ